MGGVLLKPHFAYIKKVDEHLQKEYEKLHGGAVAAKLRKNNQKKADTAEKTKGKVSANAGRSAKHEEGEWGQLREDLFSMTSVAALAATLGMTHAQQSAALSHFQTLDRSRVGALRLEDLAGAMGLDGRQRPAYFALASLAIGGSGFVSFKEFLIAAHHLKPGNDPSFHRRFRFKMCDTDNLGIITFEKMHEFLLHLHYPDTQLHASKAVKIHRTVEEILGMEALDKVTEEQFSELFAAYPKTFHPAEILYEKLANVFSTTFRHKGDFTKQEIQEAFANQGPAEDIDPLEMLQGGRGRENDMDLEDFEEEGHAGPVALPGPILPGDVAGAPKLPFAHLFVDQDEVSRRRGQSSSPLAPSHRRADGRSSSPLASRRETEGGLSSPLAPSHGSRTHGRSTSPLASRGGGEEGRSSSPLAPSRGTTGDRSSSPLAPSGRRTDGRASSPLAPSRGGREGGQSSSPLAPSRGREADGRRNSMSDVRGATFEDVVQGASSSRAQSRGRRAKGGRRASILGVHPLRRERSSFHEDEEEEPAPAPEPEPVKKRPEKEKPKKSSAMDWTHKIEKGCPDPDRRGRSREGSPSRVDGKGQERGRQMSMERGSSPERRKRSMEGTLAPAVKPFQESKDFGPASKRVDDFGGAGSPLAGDTRGDHLARSFSPFRKTRNENLNA
ncbi:hypothetical protein T484DRAFT_2736143 [Baffinella frigidus]|nr:hypothetical protein T484DRAFT_2736143 [Cryptophyta sp. CCMP2293]